MRSAFHKLLHVGDALERALDHALVVGRELRGTADLVHVVAVSLGRRNAAGGGMRLLKEARVRQIRHYVADRSRTQTLAVHTRQSARTDRLTGSDIAFHNRGEDLVLAG